MIPYLVGLGVAVIATLIYLKIKKDSAESLLINTEVKEQVNELGKDLAKNDGLLEAEALKRKELQNQLEKSKNENPDTNNLINFFNNRKK